MILILYFWNRFCLWKHDLPEEQRSHTTLLEKWLDQKETRIRAFSEQSNLILAQPSENNWKGNFPRLFSHFLEQLKHLLWAQEAYLNYIQLDLISDWNSPMYKNYVFATKNHYYKMCNNVCIFNAELFQRFVPALMFDKTKFSLKGEGAK